jgi:hypothetical protein
MACHDWVRFLHSTAPILLPIVRFVKSSAGGLRRQDSQDPQDFSDLFILPILGILSQNPLSHLDASALIMPVDDPSRPLTRS